MYIGRAFAIVVLGGMGSIPGMVIAALLIGVVEAALDHFGRLDFLDNNIGISSRGSVVRSNFV